MNAKICFIFLFMFLGKLAYSQQNAKLISFNQLENKINSDSSAIFIVNFWATW